ncbi:MAG: cytochrome c oxidase subunit 3 family protein [Chthoniobacterales bacterium]|nr:cytochrome c oxidase subunit 3 family protein [Chthoniobacterales bacterium]
MSEAAAGNFLAEQFDDLEQQHEAAKLGMWIFLATEVLFFGGLFLAYTVYRYLSPEAFAAASRHTEVILGGANTAILLFSSTLMALAVRAAQLGRRGHLIWLLLATAFLGMVFMGVKGIEYHKDFTEHLVPGAAFQWHEANPGAAEMFFWLYFAMTGLHAIHVTVGIVLMLVLAWLAHRGKFTNGDYMTVEVVGLYWHFVDIVWVFLFPMLYLAGHR